MNSINPWANRAFGFFSWEILRGTWAFLLSDARLVQDLLVVVQDGLKTKSTSPSSVIHVFDAFLKYGRAETVGGKQNISLLAPKVTSEYGTIAKKSLLRRVFFVLKLKKNLYKKPTEKHPAD